MAGRGATKAKVCAASAAFALWEYFHNNNADFVLYLKDLLVLVIDVGPMMDVAPPLGGETPIELSLRIACQIVAQKVIKVSASPEQ